MSKRILFVIAAIILLGTGIFFRASNARTARVEADQIVANDAAGQDTAAPIDSLKDFVRLHMGASVSFALNGAYGRAQTAAQASAASAVPNAQVYADAQRACAGKSDSVTQAKCNQDYVAQRLSGAPTPTPVPAPRLADYQHSLKAPLWTPDLAGALLLGSAASIAFSFIIGKGSR